MRVEILKGSEMAEPKYFIACRDAIPWGKINTVAELAAYSPRSKNIMDEVGEWIEAWNACFGMTFFEGRRRIAEIAKQNWAAVPDVDGIFTSLELAREAADIDDVILPVDDDDWFAPIVVYTLRSLPFGRLVYWDDVAFESLPLAIIRRTNSEDRRCRTNSYATRVKNNSWLMPMLKHHAKVATPKLQDGEIDGTGFSAALSCANKSILSVTQLARRQRRQQKNGRTKSDMSRDMWVSWVHQVAIYKTRPEESDTRWIRPYIDQMQKLYAEILDSVCEVVP